ncbi:MAG TPA: hypothetical protein VFU04_05170 [Solirubrobacterales bacterium]|nr:hypothetical protein [Solirubrobacterales bacterium]
MAIILLSAVVVCFGALFLGQAALRLAGAREWNWLAPAVGLSVAMLVAAPTPHVPGRSATVAILLAVLAIAAAAWCLRSPPHRPSLRDLLAALPVAFLALVPFLAAGRGGILGVTVNNDMVVHLTIAESFLSSAAAETFPLPKDYPLGPHALAALLSKGTGAEVDLAFSGLTLALPVVSAWTVMAAARRAPWLGKVVAATVAGMPFLVAAYYGQGSFKEVAQAGLVLAVALSVSGCGPRLGRGRWVPLALLTGGIVSAYSPAGLPWVVAILGLWLAGSFAVQARRGRLHEVPQTVRRELPAVGIGLAVLVVVLLPQARRMWEFVASRDGTGIAVDDIGNLVGRLPGWEALGIWDSPDYRLPASEAFIGGPWSWLMVAAILFGAFWAVRRGRWLLPLAAAAAMLIWKVSDGSQSPYVAAKALMIASPLLLLVASFPLIDPGPRRPRRWQWVLLSMLGLVLFVRVGGDDLRALRFSPVGPIDHSRQLMSFRPLVTDKPTLFLGADEFIMWWMAGVPAKAMALGPTPQVPIRPEKGWEFGQAIDFDTVPVSILNEYEWIVAPRDVAGSEPPQGLQLVRSTDAFQVWKRVSEVDERSILTEGDGAGAILRCSTDHGRAILERGGLAAIRPQPVVVAASGASAGETLSVRMNLAPGSWQLQAPYTSHRPVEVKAPGLSEVLPANLDRPGPRLPIGRITIDRQRPFSLSFHVRDTALAPASSVAIFNYVVATPAGRAERVVPVARACGKYVDWYRPAR